MDELDAPLAAVVAPPAAAARGGAAALTPLDLGEIDVDAPLELGPQARLLRRLRAATLAT
jgi:hypothetical protein